MIGKLLPLLLAILGLGAGVGAGLALRPEPEVGATDLCGPAAEGMPAAEVPPQPVSPIDAQGALTKDYVKLNNQFIVPILQEGSVRSMIILSLSLEVPIGGSELVYKLEPKLRDNLLQVLFDHANTGGFSGAFTDANKMAVLRLALLETAQRLIGSQVSDVLISDIARQDG